MRGIADYELAEVIGSGSHGRFYKATPPPRLISESEWVAVKVLDRQVSVAEFDRFAEQLRLIASVKSEYLEVPVDAGQQEGQPFYTIVYHPEGSLHRPNDGLPLGVIVRAVADAARGAHALHEIGVAHRNIKPSNILLDRGRGRLSDVGLAQVLHPGATITGTGPIATLECMAPTRVLGGKATRATEIWELGATLHKAITRRSVMGEIPDHDILDALRYVTSTQPTLDEGLPAEIRPVIEACLSEDPQQRPATAQELAERLEGHSA